MSLEPNELITMENSIEDLIALVGPCGKNIPCGEAMTTLKIHKGLTIKDGLKTKPFVTEYVSYWVLENIRQFFNEEVRLEFIKNIKTEMQVFSIYLNYDDLSENEDILLKSKFEGKLPKAEKELEDGVLERKKDG